MTDEPGNVSSLGAARSNKAEDPADLDLVTALDAAREWIGSLDHKPEHVIVLVGRDMPDGSSGTRCLQAGTYRYHSQQGLCFEGMQMLRESG